MTVLLLLATLGFLAMRSDNNRFWPLCVFTVPAIAFHCFAPYIKEIHFVTAGFLDMLVLAGLARLTCKSRLIKGLAVVSVISFILNAFGCVIYELGYPPTLYDGAFVALYVSVVIMVLINGHFNNNSKDISLPRLRPFRNHPIIKDF